LIEPEGLDSGYKPEPAIRKKLIKMVARTTLFVHATWSKGAYLLLFSGTYRMCFW
jgi:hypothetical protein